MGHISRRAGPRRRLVNEQIEDVGMNLITVHDDEIARD